MSSIRLRYSGLVNFISRIISVGTGLMFTIVVSRRLSEEAFGTWQFYSSILSYFTIPLCIVNYWLIRDLGRGRTVVKSGVFFNSFLSLILALAFLTVLPVFSSQVFIDMPTACAFVLWIIVIYHTASLEAVSQGTAPQVIGYGIIVFEISKVIIGAILVGYMRLLLLGAVLSVDLALLIQALYYFLKLSKYFRGNFSLEDVQRWFRMSFVPLISAAPSFVTMLDVLVLTFTTGSILPVAYVKVVNLFASAIAFSGALAIGLYPKLLSGGTGRDIESSIDLVLMFLIPMVFGQLVLAEPLLYILREEYGPLYNVLRVSSLCYAIIVFKGIFSMVIQGIERVDEMENLTLKKLAGSYLMKIPLIELMGSISYVAILSLTVKILHDLGSSSVLISLSSISCSLLVNIILTLYYLKVSRNIVRYRFNFYRIFKFLLSGAIMSILLLLFYPESAKSEQIFIVMVSLMPAVLLGIIVYFTILFIIDGELRKSLVATLKSFRIRKND
ncbi:MAG: hypothetical protein FGF52_04770 [Candidatus Brockarchaeota archaeon]|nr:hypothetical protein [Candidatus Brockarchaeota archaeon]